MRSYSAAAVFIDDSATERNTVLNEIGKIHYYDSSITDIYVLRDIGHKNVLKKWGIRNGVNVIYQPNGRRKELQYAQKSVVVYLGHTRNSGTYLQAIDEANELNCDLIILP